jgi:ribosomal 30S subunit maturation factor RimM
MPKKIPQKKTYESDYEEGDYYVQDIIDYRVNQGVEEYLIWWEGYGKD